VQVALRQVLVEGAGVEEGEEEGELVVGKLREGGVAGGGLALLVAGQHVPEPTSDLAACMHARLHPPSARVLN